MDPIEFEFSKFLEMRKARKKPPTPHAIELLKETLSELAGNDQALAIAIIKRSTRNSWLDFYPLSKKDDKQGFTKNATERDRAKDSRNSGARDILEL